MTEKTKSEQVVTSAKTGEAVHDPETSLSEFEYAIWHLGAAFSQWRRDCLGSVADGQISNTEASILHVIHMYGTPKSLMDISRLLHRDDVSNIQYGLKKLAQLELIEKQGNSRKNMTYVISPAGNSIIDEYLERRRRVLLRLFQQVAPSASDLSDLVVQMHVMIGIYDQSRDLIMSRQP